LERKGEFDANMESKVNILKGLMKGTKTMTLDMLGELWEERIKHEGITTTKNHPNHSQGEED
jgi:hypothetical protein